MVNLNIIKGSIVQINGNIGEPWRSVVGQIFFRIIPNLIDSAVTAPAVIACVSWFFIPLIPLQSLMGGSFKLIFDLFPFIPKNININSDNSETILRGWATVTLVIFLLKSLIAVIWKQIIIIDRMEKLMIRVVLGIPVVSLFIFTIFNVLAGIKIKIVIYLMFIFLVLATYLFLGAAWVIHGITNKMNAIYGDQR
ncbi:MAG: hypothetical protein WC596_04005 [Candidatus Shapirobacteria bacterium]